MIRRCLALAMCFTGFALTKQQANRTLHDMWAAAMEGDAVKYHSFLAPDVVVITNGQVEDGAWGQLDFIRDRFSKMRYQEMAAVTPLGLDTQGTAFVNYNWEVTLLHTGEDIDMGMWSSAFRFNPNGKIQEIFAIAPERPLLRLIQSLTTKPDIKGVLESFLSAVSAGNAQEAAKKLDKDFYFQKNGEDDEMWTGGSLARVFRHANWQFRLLEFAAMGPFDALANVETTVTAKTGGQPLKYLQGWHVSFDSKNSDTLTGIVSILDSLSAYETDQIVHARQ